MLGDAPQEWVRGSITVSTDRVRLDLDQALALLLTVPWTQGMRREVLAVALAESMVFAIYDGDELIGITRVVTDRSTYGYITDVVIAEHRRGQGLGRWIIECVMAHRDLQTLRRLTLLTNEAPWLYEKLGFAPGSGRAAYFERKATEDRGQGFRR